MKEPVLERDGSSGAEDRAIGNRGCRHVRVVVALQRGEPVPSRATADVVLTRDEVGIGEEALDVRRRRPLGRWSATTGACRVRSAAAAGTLCF